MNNKGFDKLNVEKLEAVNGGTNQTAELSTNMKAVNKTEKLGVGKRNVSASHLNPATPGQASNLGVASSQESKLDCRVKLTPFPESMV